MPRRKLTPRHRMSIDYTSGLIHSGKSIRLPRHVPHHASQSTNEHNPDDVYSYYAARRESSLVCGTVVTHQNLESRCQLRPHMTAPAARSHIPISLCLQMAPLSFSLDPGLITLIKHHSQSISLKDATRCICCAVPRVFSPVFSSFLLSCGWEVPPCTSGTR